MKMSPTIERVPGTSRRFRWLAMIPTAGPPETNPNDPSSVLVPVSALATARRTKLGARLWVHRQSRRMEVA